MSILKEREEKKRIEAEAKEKRRIERERKKKEREEIAKCKAEERARKAAERSQRLVKKSAPKERAPVPAVQRKKRKTTNDDMTNDDIDPNQCCVCFRTFTEDELEKTGLEWVECVCKRWLHEDCIDYATNVDVELLCPYCCV